MLQGDNISLHLKRNSCTNIFQRIWRQLQNSYFLEDLLIFTFRDGYSYFRYICRQYKNVEEKKDRQTCLSLCCMLVVIATLFPGGSLHEHFSYRSNQHILLQTFKIQFLCVDNIYCLCIVITCDYQTFHYSDKIWFSLKDASQICSPLSARAHQILMFKPRPITLYIQFKTHVHQDYKNHFSFQYIRN